MTIVDDKHNVLYFEAPSMRSLYNIIESWQKSANKRLLSINVQQEGNNYCCIALTNPMEVTIISGGDSLRHPGNAARVEDGRLFVYTGLRSFPE